MPTWVSSPTRARAQGGHVKWRSKKNFDCRKLANRDRLIHFFNHNCSHLALPKKLLKSMPEEAVSVEDLTLWFEEDDEDSLEIIKEYGLEVWQAKELQVLAQQRSMHDLLRELTPDPGQPADQFTRFLHPLIEEGYEEIDDLDDLVVDDEYDKLMSYNRKYKSNPQKRSAMMWSELRGMNMTYSEAHRISEMATEWASRYMFKQFSHNNASDSTSTRVRACTCSGSPGRRTTRTTPSRTTTGRRRSPTRGRSGG